MVCVWYYLHVDPSDLAPATIYAIWITEKTIGPTVSFHTLFPSLQENEELVFGYSTTNDPVLNACLYSRPPSHTQHVLTHASLCSDEDIMIFNNDDRLDRDHWQGPSLKQLQGDNVHTIALSDASFYYYLNRTLFAQAARNRYILTSLTNPLYGVVHQAIR